jgi:hypothetical protein
LGPCRPPWQRGSRDGFDLARLQRRRRIREATEFRERSLGHAVAAAVAVGKAIERGHRLARHAALDRDDQLLAIELRRPQIGAVRHLRIHLAAVRRPAMARLAIALVRKIRMPAATLSGSGVGACGAAEAVVMSTSRTAARENADFMGLL